MQPDFIGYVQKFVANAISISAVRKMGPKGTLSSIRKVLKEIDLATISRKNPSQFAQVLDDLTEALRREMPAGARHWGVARKCLNLFFRDCLYNFYLKTEYDLSKFEKYLEIPLDSYSGHALRQRAQRIGVDLPRWATVKGLTPELSAKFQAAASRIARNNRTHRLHLDIFYWRAEERTQ